MGTQQKELKLSQATVLIWVKVLNDFKDADNPNDTLDDKIEKFNNETLNMDIDTFRDGLEKMCSMGVLELSGEEPTYKLTTKGKMLMTALSPAKGFSDETIQKIMNGVIKMEDFIKEHGMEVISIFASIMFN